MSERAPDVQFYAGRLLYPRFETRKVGRKWRVYDRHTANFPYSRPELGVVKQDVTEAEALAEAERLNQAHTGQNEAQKTRFKPRRRA
jgi:hypothetical protein